MSVKSSAAGLPEKTTASIPIGYSRLVARQLRLQERDLGILLSGSGVSIEGLMDDAMLLTKTQQLKIMHNALEYSGNPAFGLQLGRALTPLTHGPLGFLASSSPDLGTAIKNFQDFIPARVNFFRSETTLRKDTLECRFDVDTEGDVALYRCLSECFLLALIALIESVVGREFTEGRIYCAYLIPAYAGEYDRAFRCPIRFSASANKLTLPERLLSTVNVSSDSNNYEFALKQCQRMADELDDSERPMTQRLKKQLLSHPPGTLSEDMAARQSFISKRTLARRLETEESSFRQLREELLMALAASYLRDTKLSVESIAGLLNYHDSSSFRRAFKRWKGITPVMFRQDA